MEAELASEALNFSSQMARLLDQAYFGTFILRQSSKSQHKYRLFCLRIARRKIKLKQSEISAQGETVKWLVNKFGTAWPQCKLVAGFHNGPYWSSVNPGLYSDIKIILAKRLWTRR
jgi:hypothetical protein